MEEFSESMIRSHASMFWLRPTSSLVESMSQIPLWFERKFEFSFPTELYPNLQARLRGTPARIEETLRNRSSNVLIRKPEGKWSAQEHAGHLLVMDPLWLARVGDYVAGSDQLTAADLQNRKTDEANYNSLPLEQILSEFRSVRGKLLKRVEELDPSLFSRVLPHPRLKTPMRLVDHLFFVAEHDDHHLARIWELLT
jgi:uncharacterized damage-inducible protein DinB